MKKIFTVLTVVLLGIAANAQVTVPAVPTESEGWGTLVAPTTNPTVKATDGVVYLKAWWGVEGYDLKITVDADENVTSITPVVNGVEDKTVTSGYCGIKTGLSSPDVYFVYFYVGEGYNYAAVDKEGYACLSGYFYTSSTESTEGYYNVEWNYETSIGAAIEEDNQSLADIWEVVGAIDDECAETGFTGYMTLKAAEIEALVNDVKDYQLKMQAAGEEAETTWVYNSPLDGALAGLNETAMGLYNGITEAQNAIEEEYEADIENMHALATALEEFVNGTEEVFPGYLKLKADEVAALYKTIEGLNNKVTAALEVAVEETGVYEGLTGKEVTEANETLMGLVAGLEETTKAIADEYEADVENVNALATALQEFNNELEYFPAFEEAHKAELAALTATVETLNNKINAAMEAAWETGVYEGLSGEEVVAANEAFMGLVAERDAALAAFEDEYDQDVENIQDLMEAFMGLQNDEKFPAFAEINEDKLVDIAQALFALSQQADSSLAKAMQTGVYEGVSTKDIEAVKADLMALITAQAEDLASIDKSYLSDLEWLESYAVQVSEEDLDSDNEAVREAAGAVKQYLFELFEDVNKAYQTALNETGKYVSPMTNAAVTKIQELLSALIVTGIDMIEAEIANGVQYYDLNGVNIKNPVSGKVYIRVANGATSKVRVK